MRHHVEPQLAKTLPRTQLRKKQSTKQRTPTLLLLTIRHLWRRGHHVDPRRVAAKLSRLQQEDLEALAVPQQRMRHQRAQEGLQKSH